jgi:hypothetical protein
MILSGDLRKNPSEGTLDQGFIAVAPVSILITAVYQ